MFFGRVGGGCRRRQAGRMPASNRVDTRPYRLRPPAVGLDLPARSHQDGMRIQNS